MRCRKNTSLFEAQSSHHGELTYLCLGPGFGLGPIHSVRLGLALGKFQRAHFRESQAGSGSPACSFCFSGCELGVCFVWEALFGGLKGDEQGSKGKPTILEVLLC